MERIKLTVIGGGSVNWMRTLMRDVYLLDSVSGGEIVLVDPNVEHAEIVRDMLLAFNKMRNKDFTVSINNKDRKEALRDADFVLTTYSPGRMNSFFNDLELPIKYGIRQPVSVTVGAAGISHGLRSVPVAYELVEEMEEACPGAWLLNVTNPMSQVTRAMNMAAKTVKVVGMCHEFHGFNELMKSMFSITAPEGLTRLEELYKWLPEAGYDYTVAGINHFIWLTKLTKNGEDLIPAVREYAKTHETLCAKKGAENEEVNLPIVWNPWENKGEAKIAACRAFGYLPLMGDRHLVEFMPHLCNIRNGYAMKYGVLKTTVDYRLHNTERNAAQLRRIADGKEAPSWEKSSEEMTEIMDAIVRGTETTGIINAPNTGQITNMPKDVIVETLATISRDGIKPKHSGALPSAIGTLCRHHIDGHELVVKAALEGDRDVLIEAMSLDPLNGLADLSELTTLTDELLLANKKWLPRFWS